MVGHHQIDSQVLEIGDLAFRGDTVVDGHDDLRVGERDDAVEGGAGKTVALVEAMRDEGRHIRAERSQRLGQQTGRGDAVDVEVTENGDALAVSDRTLDAIGDLPHTGNLERVGPVAIERRCEEELTLLDRSDTVRHHDARDERRYAQPGGKFRFELWILFGQRPSMGRFKRWHARPPPCGARRHDGILDS